jgi:hypothetical protein
LRRCSSTLGRRSSKRPWEYGTWTDWLDVPRHTFSTVLGAVIARGGDYRGAFSDLATERERRAAAGQPEALAEQTSTPTRVRAWVSYSRRGCERSRSTSRRASLAAGRRSSVLAPATFEPLPGSLAVQRIPPCRGHHTLPPSIAHHCQRMTHDRSEERVSCDHGHQDERSASANITSGGQVRDPG